MSANLSNRIPDEMLADVLAEATRLHAEATAGYSFEDLQQACAEINIPPEIIKKAIANVEARRINHRLQQRRVLAFLKQQFLKGIPLGAAIFLGAAPIIGFLRFYSPPEQRESSTPLTTMTVKEGELKYLEDPTGLSIAVRSISSTRGVTGVISMDGYQDARLEEARCEQLLELLTKPKVCTNGPAEVGQAFIYQGLYQYQIKIIKISGDNVVFQIDRSNDKLVSPSKALEQKLKALQTDSAATQQTLREQISDLEIKNYSLKQREIYDDKTIKALEREIEILKSPRPN
jgi:hypothetical protein